MVGSCPGRGRDRGPNCGRDRLRGQRNSFESNRRHHNHHNRHSRGRQPRPPRRIVPAIWPHRMVCAFEAPAWVSDRDSNPNLLIRSHTPVVLGCDRACVVVGATCPFAGLVTVLMTVRDGPSASVRDQLVTTGAAAERPSASTRSPGACRGRARDPAAVPGSASHRVDRAARRRRKWATPSGRGHARTPERAGMFLGEAWLRVSDSEQPPLVGHALKRVHTAVGEDNPRPGDEILHGRSALANAMSA
jgi:hypothetical protein